MNPVRRRAAMIQAARQVADSVADRLLAKTEPGRWQVAAHLSARDALDPCRQRLRERLGGASTVFVDQGAVVARREVR